MARKRNLKEERKIARERIVELFRQADETFSENPERAHRYVELARKVAMKYKVRIPSELQKKFCKHCYKYLMPGENVRVRTRDGKLVYTCLGCKGFMRFPFLKEQKDRRRAKESTTKE